MEVNNIFVCGTHDGKIRHMKDDHGRMVSEAFPGQAVHISGFKDFPEVGSPLYIVKNMKEAQTIVQTLKLRASQEAAMKLLEKGDTSEQVKKSIGQLTRQEKRKIKSGDKSILFSKLGIASEQDIDKLKSEFGIAKNVEIDVDNIDEILENTTKIGRKKSRFKLRNEAAEKERMKEMILEQQEKQELLELMDEEEYRREQMEQSYVREMFRDENTGYQPVMIKAAQAGALETLIAEAESIIGNQFKIQIVAEGVGPLTENEVSEASAMNAVIFGFDIPVSPMLEARAEMQGVPIKLHKLIYKFQEDL